MAQHRSRNPADRVLRVRLREPVAFPDLTERRAIKLSSIPHYTARAHFGEWHRRVGSPDFEQFTGVFTPLFFVEIDTNDLPVDPRVPLSVRGETFLAKTLDAAGTVDHLVREGHHTVSVQRDGADMQVIARVRLINVFTRYDPDPTRRRVTTLPLELGLGSEPSRVAALPSLDDLVPRERRPDFVEPEIHAWHYGQTDPNRHVNGTEYLRTMESYIADVLRGAGHDLRRLYFSRARIVYRKPGFRGEGYRRAAWIRGEAPLTITGAFYKESDPAPARPAVAIELTLSQHEDPS